VQVTVAGGLGEADRGGPAFNLIPKTGGNSFSGTYFGNIAGKWSQGDNIDDTIGRSSRPGRDHPQLGHQRSPSVDRSRRIACGSTAPRAPSARTPTSPAASPTATPATELPAGSTSPTQSIKERSATSRRIGGVPRDRTADATQQGQRLLSTIRRSAKAARTPRTRRSAACAATIGSRSAASATGRRSHPLARQLREASSSSPTPRRCSSKLLLEAAFSQFFSNWGGQTPAGALDKAPFIPVVEQSVSTISGVRWRTTRTTASPV
jgi:hypothetical protein